MAASTSTVAMPRARTMMPRTCSATRKSRSTPSVVKTAMKVIQPGQPNLRMTRQPIRASIVNTTTTSG
jgi:hypothetical protein